MLTERLGDRLAKEGYRGFFEVDFLADLDTGELYLGELNPRISGVTSMTNVTAGAYADMPLFLFHLLEYLGRRLRDRRRGDQRALGAGRRASTCGASSSSSRPTTRSSSSTTAPRTGIWKLDDETGAVAFRRWANDWHSLQDESEAFYLRVLGPGDYRYKGADLGVLVTRSRLQDDDDQLTERARTWIDGVLAQFDGTAVQAADEPPHHDALAFKSA